MNSNLKIDNKLITVGISFYNSELYLKFAIDSIIKQTYSYWKLILIDDGSSDRSLEIANSYKDERISVLSDGINKGFQIRLNQLIEATDSVYFARMDADDIMHPQRLEKQVRFLENHPHIDLVGSYAYSISSSNKIAGFLSRPTEPNSIKDVFQNNCFIHPTVMGRTKWFKANKYDDKSTRMEDFELWMRTIEKSKFYNLNEPLLFYREIGIPSIQKYLKTHSGLRSLVRKKFALRTVASYLTKSYLKCLVYYLFDKFGCIDFLIKKRSSLLNEIQIKEGQEILKKII